MKIDALKNKKNEQRGFTIIETMISVSLFMIIITVGMTALLNANLLHQKSQDMRSEMDNLSFIMEDLSRNLRTGTTYHCVVDLSEDMSTPQSTTTDADGNVQVCGGIAFESSYGSKDSLGNYDNPNDQWVYYITDTGALCKATQGPYNVGCETSGTNYLRLTPPEVYINPRSGFTIIGAEPHGSPGDKLDQPFVIVRLAGTINKNNVLTPFSLETSVSQRLVDL